MPDLRYYVRRDGKMYCWDFEKRRLVEVVLRDVPLAPNIMPVIDEIVALAAGTHPVSA
jgi:hypothetical protein